MNTITEKLKFANWFIDNVLCVDIEYIKYRPDFDECVWVYLNPYGNNENGQFVENHISKDLFAKLITECPDDDSLNDALQSDCVQYCIDAEDDLFESYADVYTEMLSDYMLYEENGEPYPMNNVCYVIDNSSSAENDFRAGLKFIANVFGIKKEW